MPCRHRACSILQRAMTWMHTNTSASHVHAHTTQPLQRTLREESSWYALAIVQGGVEGGIRKPASNASPSTTHTINQASSIFARLGQH